MTHAILHVLALLVAMLCGGVVGFALGISYYTAKQFEEAQKMVEEIIYEKQREKTGRPN